MVDTPKRRYSPRKSKTTTAGVIEEKIEAPRATPIKNAPAAKKGLDPFTKDIADVIAHEAKKIIDARVGHPDKTIASREASSIMQSTARLVDRHFGKTLRKFLPKGAQSDDFNDFKEILLSLGMWALRYAKVSMQEATLKKEEELKKLRLEKYVDYLDKEAQKEEYTPPIRQAVDVPSRPLHTLPSGEFSIGNNDVTMMNRLDSIMVANGGTNGVYE